MGALSMSRGRKAGTWNVLRHAQRQAGKYPACFLDDVLKNPRVSTNQRLGSLAFDEFMKGVCGGCKRILRIVEQDQPAT